MRVTVKQCPKQNVKVCRSEEKKEHSCGCCRINMSPKCQNGTSPKCQNDTRPIKTMDFLPAYEKQECLWNPSLDSYKNKSAREEAYKHIIKDLKDTSLTISDIKLKVKSIRTTYTKELRLQTKHKEDAKPYSPKLFWFNRANSFLKNVSLPRDKRNSSSLEKQQPVHEEEQVYVTTPQDSVAATNCVIAYNINLAAEHVEPINNDTNAYDTRSKNKDQRHDSLIIQHHRAQHHQQQYQHNDSDLSEADHQHCITLTSSTISNHDETTCVDRMIESPHLPEKIDNTSQNEVYKYYTNDSNASTTRAINVNSSTPIEHRGEIVTTEFQSFNNTAAYVDSSGLDECDIFCRSVASQMRRIKDTYSRAMAKYKIQEILFHAETGQLRINSANTIPVSQNINNSL